MSKVPGYLDDHRHGCNQSVCWHRGKEREQWNDVRKSPWANSLEMLLLAKLEIKNSYSIDPHSYGYGDVQAGRGADQCSCRVYGNINILKTLDQSLSPVIESLYEARAFYVISSEPLRLRFGRGRFSSMATVEWQSWLVDRLK